jgi:5-methyltetrahydropteroyltriglutamate--homocysteine methyltransferase
VGSLPRPEALSEMMAEGKTGASYENAVVEAVDDVVRRQVDCGIDIVDDGEQSKLGFITYIHERLGGMESRTDHPAQLDTREKRSFPEFYKDGHSGSRPAPMLCTGPITYVGGPTTAADIANMQAAMAGLGPEVEGFLPAVAPGTIEHWLYNRYYKTDEEFLFALAEAMHQEFKAITDAGLNLQIDDPDLPDGWQMFPNMSVDEYRKYAQLRVDAINHAVRDIPEEQVRLHVCWGSGLGPHQNDIDLKDIIDVILNVKAQVYSIEAANPRHQHEWRVWQDVKLPDGKSFMPGVISHATDIIEHPRLVADRLIQYANLVGKDNVIAGTDCGVGSRVWNDEIAWAKFTAMAEGARLASQELWG